MKIKRTELSELIRDEIENFKPVTEKLKMSKGSGRGTSWMNYDDDIYRMQVTKDSTQYHISIFKKFQGPSSKRLLDLRGLSKTDAAKLVKLAKSNGLEKTAKYGKSKYKKYVNEATLKESVWGLPKGSNTTNMDELDAALSRAGIKSIPDFTKLIVQVKGNKSKINKIMKTHKAKKIFEGKRQQLSIPVMDKLKTDKILKKLRLKPGKDYDVGVGSRNSFILDIEGKHLDKLITLLMKQRIRVR